MKNFTNEIKYMVIFITKIIRLFFCSISIMTFVNVTFACNRIGDMELD